MTALLLLILTQTAPLPPNHPTPSGKNAPSADELIQKLDQTNGLRERDKPYEIAASLARLYFGQGRYADASVYYGQAVARADSARSLYVAQKKLLGDKPAADAKSVGCEPKSDSTMSQFEALAKSLADKKNTAGAVGCLQVALSSLQDTEVMLGNAQFLAGDAKTALSTYDRALALFENNHEARYARAALLLDTQGDDVKVLSEVKSELERVLKDAPNFPKAANAKRLLARTIEAVDKGGLSKIGVSKEQVASIAPQPVARQPGQPPVLTKEVMEAFQNAPRTPEMEQNFIKLIDAAEEHLARGRFQEALDSYKQVMPYQPDNARLRAGMAWTMIKLNRQPMADNVWRVASGNPDAVAALGDTLKAKGDEAGAKAVWQRLAQTVPSYAPKLEGRQ
ncbi:MAG: tetratricopeptide repeat protein [Archangium sp.]